MAQHTVAQTKHVLVGGVLLVRQLLQPHQGALTPLVTERGLQNAKDLGEQGESGGIPTSACTPNCPKNPKPRTDPAWKPP